MQTQELKQELQSKLGELRTLAGEIRLQLHLANMDAKTKWDRDLEPKLFSLEKSVEREVSEKSHDAIRELRSAFRSFKDSLSRQKH